MSTPELERETEEQEMYEFACLACWAVKTVALTSGAKRPICDCGTPLSVIGEAYADDAESLSLDHPHTEPHCSFCAARQTPMQHRLWCAIYFLRNCNCGYGQRP